jgi:hypothetical protein
MNLKVLPYVAALMVPAAASGAATTFILQKLTSERKPAPTRSWTNIRPPLNNPIKVRSIRA